jgi:CRP-like cAMP-binding protein
MTQLGPRAPGFALAVAEDMLSGAQRLRRAFLEAGTHSAERGKIIVAANEPNPPAFLIHRGLAYSSTTLPDGRRAITDLFLPGDIVGTENVVMASSTQETVAACGLYYSILSATAVRSLMTDSQIAIRVLALACEAHRRAHDHVIGLTRLDARERVSALVVGIHDRLRRRELIIRPTYNLWLTQEEIGDHLGLTMVHVSRTLRRLREERLVLVDRHLVLIRDLDGLRRTARAMAPEQNDQNIAVTERVT